MAAAENSTAFAQLFDGSVPPANTSPRERGWPNSFSPAVPLRKPHSITFQMIDRMVRPVSTITSHASPEFKLVPAAAATGKSKPSSKPGAVKAGAIVPHRSG